MTRPFTFALLIGLILGGSLLAQDPATPGKTKSSKTPPPPEKVAPLPDDPMLTLAMEEWKSLNVDQGKISRSLTEKLALIGTVDYKQLDALGKLGEKVLPRIIAQMKLEKADPSEKKPENEMMADRSIWKDKLIVHVSRDRNEFRNLVSRLKKRRPQATETGVFAHDREHTHLILGPSDSGRRVFSLEQDFILQLSRAAVTRKMPNSPEWFQDGFARAMLLRAPAVPVPLERRQALILLAKVQAASKNTDVLWGDELPPAELTILRGSFVDYLATAPANTKLWNKIVADLRENDSLNSLLEDDGRKSDDLFKSWMTWARTAK